MTMRAWIALGIALAGCGSPSGEAAGTGSAGPAWWAGSSAAAAPQGSAVAPVPLIDAGIDSAAAPRVCFPTDQDHYFGGFFADDRAATLCVYTEDDAGEKKKHNTCLAVDLATGAWRRVPDDAAAPIKRRPSDAPVVKQSAKAVAVCRGRDCKKLAVRPPDGSEPYLWAVSEDGKRVILAGDRLKGAVLLNAETGKKVRTIKGTEGGCWDTVDFLDDVVYIAINVCAGPGAEGAFYSWKGKQLAKLEDINPYGAVPIHLTGTLWAFGDLGGYLVAIVDSKTLKQRLLKIPEVAQPDCDGCYVVAGSPVGADDSLVKLPSGKLVDLGTNSVAVVDGVAGKIEQQYPLPMCPKPKQQ
jgi:hypothetical protein